MDVCISNMTTIDLDYVIWRRIPRICRVYSIYDMPGGNRVWQKQKATVTNVKMQIYFFDS